MRAKTWQSPFSSWRGILKNILNLLNHRPVPFRDLDLNHIETPRHVACPQTAQPLVGTSLDELLLLPVHRSKAPQLRISLPGLHLNEQQLFTFACDDIDFPSFSAFEIAG